MESWIVALRGDEGALAEARVLFGAASTEQVGRLEAFAWKATDPAAASALLVQLSATSGDFAAGVALGTAADTEARERALALACAAAPREVLLGPTARARVAEHLVFVRPQLRAGWRLPFAAVAIAPLAPRRAEARDAAATVPANVPMVGRDAPLQALLTLCKTPEPVLVRAATGWGGGKLIREAAARAGKSIDRVPQAALSDAEGLWKTLEKLQGGDWLVVDPVSSTSALLLKRVARSLPPHRQLIVRGDFEIEVAAVPSGREVALGPLGAEDVLALVRAMLGPETGEIVVRRLARRAGFVPGRVVETVRAAIQLGELVRHGAGWQARTRRALGTLGSHDDPLAARIADLPPLLHRALAVAAAVGDGAREVDLLAAMRGTLSHAPEQLVGPLESLRLLETDGEHVHVTAAVAAQFPADDVRVTSLTRAGVLSPGARAEALSRSGRLKDAAVPYARAASAALGAGLRAAAVRFAAAAAMQGQPIESLPPEVADVLRAVASAVAPGVAVEAVDTRAAGSARTRTLDPIALEQAAIEFSERHDESGAARMRALAELMRGNSRRALRITAAGGLDLSGKDQLIAAMAQAAAGEVHRAVRTALAALAGARRSRHSAGEAAALALLSTLYRAADREDDARLLADGAKRLHAAS